MRSLFIKSRIALKNLKQTRLKLNIKLKATRLYKMHQMFYLDFDVAHIIDVGVKFARSVVKAPKFSLYLFKVAVEFLKKSDKSVGVIRPFHFFTASDKKRSQGVSTVTKLFLAKVPEKTSFLPLLKILSMEFLTLKAA